LDDSNLAGLGLPTSVAVLMGQGQIVPLAVTFKEVGSDEVFTVVVNHLKSKGAGAAELQTMIQMTELLTLTKQDLMLLQP
jgi:hypothetical protein